MFQEKPYISLSFDLDKLCITAKIRTFEWKFHNETGNPTHFFPSETIHIIIWLVASYFLHLVLFYPSFLVFDILMHIKKSLMLISVADQISTLETEMKYSLSGSDGVQCMWMMTIVRRLVLVCWHWWLMFSDIRVINGNYLEEVQQFFCFCPWTEPMTLISCMSSLCFWGCKSTLNPWTPSLTHKGSVDKTFPLTAALFQKPSCSLAACVDSMSWCGTLDCSRFI